VFFVLSGVVDTDFLPWYLRFAHIQTFRRRECCTLDGQTYDLRNGLSRRRWLYRFKERVLSVSATRRDEMLASLADELGSSPVDPSDEDYAYLRSDDLRELTALGMTIGSHSATHTNLACASDEELSYEMLDSQKTLIAMAGQAVDLISYPDGRYDRRVLRLAAEHYRFGFSASERSPVDNPWLLPRRAADEDPLLLSPWYPLKRLCIDTAARLLGCR
jgi:peptidoglycan/xylan/chitin deacetylase (PgdA/CDA1 family)